MAVVLSNEEDSYFMPTSLRRSCSKTKLADLADTFHQQNKAFSDSDNSSAPSSPCTSAHIESADASYSSIASSKFSIASDHEVAIAMDDTPDGPFSLPPSFANEQQLFLKPPVQPNGILEPPSSPSAGHAGTLSPADPEDHNPRPIPESQDSYEKAEDDTAVVSKPSRQVDYLSYEWNEEDIWSSWRYVTSKRSEFPNSARLENASWRTWIKAKNHLGTVSPETLNWLKDCDVTWLYGPLQPRAGSLFESQTEPASQSLSNSESLVNLKKKPILKKRSMSEVMLQRSISSASLLKQATAAVHAQESTRVLRPSLSRSNTDYTAISFSPRRGSQESSTWATSTDSSSITSPSTERKHIHFNEQVEQCIAVDVKGDDEEDVAIDMYAEDSGSDDGVMMKRIVSKRRPVTKRRSKKVNLVESRIIAMLPSTTLKYQKETQDFHDSAMKHSTGISPNCLLSPSSSQETLCPAKQSSKFLLGDADDLDDRGMQSPRGKKKTSNKGTGGLHRSSSTGSLFDEPAGMHRTPSGMFMPYTEPDPAAGDGLFGRVIDTVNTARDIAHVIWNVGWRK